MYFVRFPDPLGDSPAGDFRNLVVAPGWKAARLMRDMCPGAVRSVESQGRKLVDMTVSESILMELSPQLRQGIRRATVVRAAALDWRSCRWHVTESVTPSPANDTALQKIPDSGIRVAKTGSLNQLRQRHSRTSRHVKRTCLATVVVRRFRTGLPWKEVPEDSARVRGPHDQ